MSNLVNGLHRHHRIESWQPDTPLSGAEIRLDKLNAVGQFTQSFLCQLVHGRGEVQGDIRGRRQGGEQMASKKARARSELKNR